MRLEVRLHGFGEARRVVDLADGADFAALLKVLAIPSESVLVFADDAPVPIDDPVPAGVSVRVVRIVSGGSRA